MTEGSVISCALGQRKTVETWYGQQEASIVANDHAHSILLKISGDDK
jgi:hypothetical protein